MKTLIRFGNNYGYVYDHKKTLPLNEDGSVNYEEMTARIERAMPEKLNRDLTKIF